MIKTDAQSKAAGRKTAGQKATGEKATGEKAAGEKTTGQKAAAPPERSGAVPAPDMLLRTALSLVILAALWAAWTGWNWYSTAQDEDLRHSRVRAEVHSSGTQLIQNLATLDHRHLDRDLNIWLESSTGELYQQIAQGRGAFVQQLQKAKTVSTAKVMESAVAELDTEAGKAEVMAAVRVTVTPPSGEPTVKLMRFVSELTRTDEGWKVSALGQAPAGG